jgi:hypothetical protein
MWNIEMSAGEWNDAYCDIQQGYICEVNAETSYPTQVEKTFWWFSSEITF